MSFNKLTAIGNLGADVELRYSPSGIPVANFSIATTEKWTDKDGVKQEHTEWLRCVAWRNQAENIAKYLHKGSKVYVEARVRNSSYTDAEGIKRYSTEYNVDFVEFLDSKGSNGNGDTADTIDRSDVFIKITESVIKINPKSSVEEVITKVIESSADLKKNYNHKALLDVAKKLAIANPTIAVIDIIKSAVKYVQENTINTPEDLATDTPFVVEEKVIPVITMKKKK